MNEICGLTLLESFASYDHDTCCWRTSQVSLLTGTQDEYSETWPKAGMIVNGVAYRQPKWEHRIKEIGSGSWRTPSAQEPGISPERLEPIEGGEPGGMNRHFDKETGRMAQIGLNQQVALRHMWPTPTAQEVESMDFDITESGRRKVKNGKDSRSLNLARKVQMWPTPGATQRGAHTGAVSGEVTDAGRISSKGVKWGMTLQTAVHMWPTPTSTERSGINPNTGKGAGLSKAIKNWPTPKSSPSGPDFARMSREGSGGDDLATAIARENFPTPSCMDHIARKGMRPSREVTGRTTGYLSEHIAQYPTPKSRDWKGKTQRRTHAPMDGLCNTLDVTGGQLNPDWVEFYLMGWWRGWTSLEPLISKEIKEYDKKMSLLWERTETKEIWREIGRPFCIQKKEILRSKMRMDESDKSSSKEVCITQKGSTFKEGYLCNMPDNEKSSNPSYRWQYCEQCSGEHNDIMRCLSCEMALEEWENHAEKTIGLRNLWESFKRYGLLSKALSTIQEIWRSLDDKEKNWIILFACSGSVWNSEPPIPRVAVGVKDRVARLQAIGNGQVSLCTAAAVKLLMGEGQERLI